MTAKKHQGKKTLTLILLLALTGCATTSFNAEENSYTHNFFAPNADFYLTMRPKKLPLKNLLQSNEMDLSMLFNRSSYAQFYWQDLGLTGYMAGSFPKGIIDGALNRNEQWVKLRGRDGFRDLSSGLEISLPSSNNLFITQNMMDSILDQKNPPMQRFMPAHAVKSFYEQDFTLYVPSPHQFFQNYLSPLAAISGISSLRIALLKESSHYQSAIQFDTDNPSMARGIALVIRTAIPQLRAGLPFLSGMEVSIVNSSVVLNGLLSEEQTQQMLDLLMGPLLKNLA